jgi:protein O-mannosyl-transferase
LPSPKTGYSFQNRNREFTNRMNNSKTISGLLGLLLLAFVGALYGQFLWNPIIFDDRPFFMPNEVGVLPLTAFHFSLFEIRSLPYATLAWTQAWFGQDLINFRVGNMLLHAAVVVVLFFFLQRLFSVIFNDEKSTTQADGLSPRLAAFFAALLFALHPVSTYAVGYLVQRTIVMATLFSLLAMLAYLEGSVREKRLWLWLSVPFYFLAVFSKEHAIMLPAVLAMLTVLLHEDWREKLKKKWGIFAAHALIAIFVLLAMKGLLGSVYEFDGSTMLQNNIKLAYPLSVLTQMWLFFKYAFLWALPNSARMSIDIREPFAGSLASVYLFALIAYATWGIVAAWLLLKRGQLGLLGFALLFPWVLFLTEFSAVRIQEVFVLYRSYLWAVGAFCVLPLVFVKVNGRIASMVLSVVALAMVPISMERLMVLSQPLFVWDDAEKLVATHQELPGAYRIYYNRGVELILLGSTEKAIIDLNQAISLKKDFSPIYGALGVAYLKKGDPKAAIKTFGEGIEFEKKAGRSVSESEGNLGIAYFRNGDWKDAVAAYTRAIQLAHSEGGSPGSRDLVGRAEAFEKLGDLQKSQADYKLACDLAKKGCDKLK